MDLLQTFSDYASKDQAVEKAAFEAAMVEKLKDHPYKMSDLLYNMYKCQRDIEVMGSAITTLAVELAELLNSPAQKPSSTSKKKKSHAKKSA